MRHLLQHEDILAGTLAHNALAVQLDVEGKARMPPLYLRFCKLERSLTLRSQ